MDYIRIGMIRFNQQTRLGLLVDEMPLSMDAMREMVAVLTRYIPLAANLFFDASAGQYFIALGYREMIKGSYGQVGILAWISNHLNPRLQPANIRVSLEQPVEGRAIYSGHSIEDETSLQVIILRVEDSTFSPSPKGNLIDPVGPKWLGLIRKFY
jgi:hypothetical protein